VDLNELTHDLRCGWAAGEPILVGGARSSMTKHVTDRTAAHNAPACALP
jgi:hypothetical protein